MTLTRFAKTKQVITTVTPRWLARIDGYAVAHEQSRADAVRTAVEAAVVAWEQANNLTYVDPAELGEGDPSGQ